MKGYERHLRAAAVVAETRNFGRAARRLAISQPALSVMVSDLEKRLGAPLFHRTTRVVEPTDYALRFLKEVSQIFDELDAATRSIEEIGTSKKGKVIVSCLSSISSRLMPRVLTCLWRDYPNVELIIRDDVATRSLSALVEGEADLTVTASMVIPAGLETVPLIRDPVFVCFPEDHRFAGMGEVRWRDLHDESLVLLATTSAMRGMIDGALAEARVQARRRIEVSHLVTIYGMVTEGIGVAILPELALPDGRSTRSLVRPIVEPSLSRTISVSWRRDRQLTPPAKAVLASISTAVADLGYSAPDMRRAGL
jgi:DNA-binding transcriptional LysR family regulator